MVLTLFPIKVWRVLRNNDVLEDSDRLVYWEKSVIVLRLASYHKVSHNLILLC
jgi:hypothetical protein